MTTKNLILLISIFVLSACSNNPKADTNNTSNDTLLQVNATGFESNEGASTYYRFPTPNEIFSFIDNEKLRFNPALLNPISNANTYLDSKSQSLALGTYISDLAYITTFKSFNKSVDYYMTISQLSEKTRISFAHNHEVAKRIEKNLLNVDSLKNISSESYASIVEYLIVNNREKTLALIATGAYIECFHIAFQLVGNFSNNNPMVPKIIDLKYAFENLYSYLQIYSDSEDVKYMVEKLKPLNILFGQLGTNEGDKTTVKQDKNGKIIISGGATFKMDEALFVKLKEEVSKVRNSIVNNN